MAGRAKQWASRLTGFSIPAFGLQWQPAPADRDTATELLAHLEDRRVLFNPSEAESPRHCAMSAVEIRRLLSTLLAKTGGKGELADHIRAMGAAARRFLDRLDREDDPEFDTMASWGHWRSWEFQDALGQMRGAFGFHIAAICSRFDLDVQGDINVILPPLVEADEFAHDVRPRIGRGRP